MPSNINITGRRYSYQSQSRSLFLSQFLLIVVIIVVVVNIRFIPAFQRFRVWSSHHHISGDVGKVEIKAMFSSSLSSTPSSLSSSYLNDSIILNPLLESWTAQPFSLPPFEKIQTDHFRPALEVGMKEHLKDLRGIVDNPDPPTFDNVVVAYDRTGKILEKVSGVFGNMCSSQNTPELQEIQTEMTPILSRHGSATYTLPGLFEKIQQVYHEHQRVVENEEDELTDEDRRLIERIHMDFTRSGAHFTVDKQKENADIQAALASLTTEFMQNVLKDEETYELILKRDDLAGCPDSLIEAAKNAAEERNKVDDEYVITLSRSLVEPFLTFSNRRDLRKIAWEAWTSRGEMDPERNNLKIATDILKLRQKQARMHGFKNFAEYQLVDRMAKTPENVIQLLENVWEKAKVSANQEREAMEEFIKQNNAGIHNIIDDDTQDIIDNGLQPWDWRYYSGKVRIAKYDFDESLLKPYLSLNDVINAVMAVSNKIFGLRYILRDDITSYHESVKTYEVRNERDNDKLVAIFLHDNFARPYKSGGAWMSEYRSQTKNFHGEAKEHQGIPIVSNNNNFAKGRNTLLSFDDATTLFHEMVRMFCVWRYFSSSFLKQNTSSLCRCLFLYICTSKGSRSSRYAFGLHIRSFIVNECS
mmetsp:Transcript_32964/g.37430  ORF Transcript_32964/g.37430 Transcript_32964/m.37430 type:complete len:643 (+) Transcript_32964:57-1985(+)